MRLRNDRQGYGLVSVGLHWIMAVLVIGLFLLGETMVDLDYTHPWYHKAPDLHRGLGVVTAGLLAFRLVWRLANPLPEILGRPWERRAALWVHRLFYLLIAAVVTSGYLITTADGQALSVFGAFEIPATLHGLENQEDIAGRVHEWLATLLIALAALHGLAALKHHLLDRDPTLLRMLGAGGPHSSSPTRRNTP
ncbi:cytochrome b [Thiohalobacter sp. IOR34]|uniref:cytochrome b n=1 Tax=Thiohalobacter sp. IOR34 TaxID=3057176 RepID=UPI0025AFB4AC|nr:cytochrome b [Thiohalobacter sp. IOR34]WJW76439.1 cytochrome b [Thiohalobacter sp. IOR34]